MEKGKNQPSLNNESEFENPTKDSPEARFMDLYANLAINHSDEEIEKVREIHQKSIDNSINSLDDFRFTIAWLNGLGTTYDHESVLNKFKYKTIASTYEYDKKIPESVSEKIGNIAMRLFTGREPVPKTKHIAGIDYEWHNVFDLELNYAKDHLKPITYPSYWPSLVLRNFDYQEGNITTNILKRSSLYENNSLPDKFDPIVLGNEDPGNQINGWQRLYDLQIKPCEKISDSLDYGLCLCDADFLPSSDDYNKDLETYNEVKNIQKKLGLKYTPEVKIGYSEAVSMIDPDIIEKRFSRK